MFRQDPGPCPICGAPHTTCTASSGPITLAQLPARDQLAQASSDRLLEAAAAPAAVAEAGDPASPRRADPGEFTTGTYRGTKKGRR